MELLCFDSSGSTSGCTKYWNTVEKLVKSNKFDALLSWNSYCTRVSNSLGKRGSGGTEPSTFLDYIINNFNKDHIEQKFGKDAKLTLQVTTDGGIGDSDIAHCAEYLSKPNFPSLKTVTIHYIGYEGAMNFGLNAIFGSVAELSFSINDTSVTKKVPSVAELENYDDIFTPEFVSFLCSRVTDLKTSDFDAFDRLRKTLQAKLDTKYKQLDESKPINPKEYFDKGDAKGLEKAIKAKMFTVENTEFQSWKNKILSCFDKCASITISDTRAKANLKSTVLKKPKVVAGYKFDDETIVVEDSITFENIDEGKICVLVKFNQPALFKPDSNFVKNPFLVFQNENIRTQMIKRFELHPMSINTVKELTKGSVTESPFTRDECRAFILGPANMNEIDFNSQALASFFESEKRNTIYGNKVIWQLVVLYLLKKHIDSTVQKDESVTWPRDELHPLINAILKEYILNETLRYHLTLHVRIALPVDRVPLYVALWYIILVSSMYAPNSTRNLLRYPYGTVLLDLFNDANLQDKIPIDDVIRKRLYFRIKLWKLWNTMLGHKKDLELDRTIRAGYQNYCIVQDKIVLLSGHKPTELPAPDLVSGIPPSVVKVMWDSLTPKSTRFQKINQDGNNLPRPKWVILKNDTTESREVFHMQIDPDTLRPFAKCPVSNKPIAKCVGKFDIKSESYARIFSLYCAKYKKYPENSDQLVLLHNRKRAKNNVSSVFIEKYMKHVFDIYQPIVGTMSCAEFVKKYNSYVADKSIKNSIQSSSSKTKTKKPSPAGWVSVKGKKRAPGRRGRKAPPSCESRAPVRRKRIGFSSLSITD
ncbi:uncharacterized protein LOC135838502 [Planococcus citri]|uniref:uncharacterized protein LOC135838502 n=1 Tax=Planococcus citri TaxID=170843 RepID=UPI0031F94D1D